MGDRDGLVLVFYDLQRGGLSAGAGLRPGHRRPAGPQADAAAAPVPGLRTGGLLHPAGGGPLSAPPRGSGTPGRRSGHGGGVSDRPVLREGPGSGILRSAAGRAFCWSWATPGPPAAGGTASGRCCCPCARSTDWGPAASCWRRPPFSTAPRQRHSWPPQRPRGRSI